jgi:hypothetical protein
MWEAVLPGLGGKVIGGRRYWVSRCRESGVHQRSAIIETGFDWVKRVGAGCRVGGSGETWAEPVGRSREKSGGGGNRAAAVSPVQAVSESWGDLGGFFGCGGSQK